MDRDSIVSGAFRCYTQAEISRTRFKNRKHTEKPQERPILERSNDPDEIVVQFKSNTYEEPVPYEYIELWVNEWSYWEAAKVG